MAVQNILHEALRLIQRTNREACFIATVVSTGGNGIKVRRDSSPTDDGVFYAAAAGLAAAVSAGDRVLVIDASGSGGYVVVCEVVQP